MSALPVVTSHKGAVLDMVTDGTGRFVATAGEDGAIGIYEARGSTTAGSTAKPAFVPVATLSGAHEAPVIRVAWATPRCAGLPLASSSVDGQVNIWKDPSGKGAEWTVVYGRRFPAPVVALAWSPEEFGIALACACADGKVYVVDGSTKQAWNVTHFDAHTTAGCTGVSWAPYLPPNALATMPLVQGPAGANQPQPPAPIPRLVTCGQESTVRIWRYSRADQTWLHEHDLQDSPSSTQREVAWAPNVGLPFSYVAAGSDERYVTIWLQDGLDGVWRAVALPPFEDAVVRISWSLVGTFLLVSCANDSASIWKEDVHGGWSQVSKLDTAQAQPSQQNHPHPPQQQIYHPSQYQQYAPPPTHQQ